MHEIIAVLGPPTAQPNVQGEQWYVWERAHLTPGGAGEAWCKLAVHDPGTRPLAVRVSGNRAGCNPMLQPFLEGLATP